jgi:hypothetical protein
MLRVLSCGVMGSSSSGGGGSFSMSLIHVRSGLRYGGHRRNTAVYGTAVPGGICQMVCADAYTHAFQDNLLHLS